MLKSHRKGRLPEPGAAVITGAASGLGRAVAETLARAGWRLALIDLPAATSAAGHRHESDRHGPGLRDVPALAAVPSQPVPSGQRRLHRRDSRAPVDGRLFRQQGRSDRALRGDRRGVSLGPPRGDGRLPRMFVRHLALHVGRCGLPSGPPYPSRSSSWVHVFQRAHAFGAMLSCRHKRHDALLWQQVFNLLNPTR